MKNYDVTSELYYLACDFYTKYLICKDMLYLHYSDMFYCEYKDLGGEKDIMHFLNNNISHKDDDLKYCDLYGMHRARRIIRSNVC